MHIKVSENDFFLSKVQIDESTGCWVWIGTRRKKHQLYGSFKYGGKQEQAHRAALRLFKGIQAGDGIVRHRCKNAACVNPDHLEIGTDFDNAQDRTTHWTLFKSMHPELVAELDECKRRVRNAYDAFVVDVSG